MHPLNSRSHDKVKQLAELPDCFLFFWLLDDFITLLLQRKQQFSPKKKWMIGRLYIYIPFQVAFAVGFMEGTYIFHFLGFVEIPWKLKPPLSGYG